MENLVGVKVINKSKHALPSYSSKPGESDRNSGMDIRANIGEPIILHPNESVVIPTGLYFKLPEGWEFQVRSRSGLAAKYKIFVLNSPGTIDESFVNKELKVILFNLGNSDFTIEDGDRIAQLVLAPRWVCVWDTNWSPNESDEDRKGDAGLGHSGVK